MATLLRLLFLQAEGIEISNSKVQSYSCSKVDWVSRSKGEQTTHPKYSGRYLRLGFEYYGNSELGKAIVYLSRCVP